MSAPETHIDLYTWGTPNGKKTSITLEELGLKYTVHPIDLGKNTQKEEWYLRINPNGRIPAIVDHTPKADGTAQVQRVFETAAIMLYLTARYDADHKISYPYNSSEYWEMVSFLQWQHGAIGPMMGQAAHFMHASEKIPYAIDRYTNETKRLFSVLETTLADKRNAVKDVQGDGPWLVGDRCTIADLSCFPWVNSGERMGINMAEFPHVNDWLQQLRERPGVKRGLEVPKRE